MKTTLITGAAKGLGLALTNAFVNEGWYVIAACHRAADFSSRHEKIEVVELNVEDADSIHALAKYLEGKVIDVLINNAGIYDNDHDHSPVITDMRRVTEIFRINAIAPMLISEALVSNLEHGSEKLVLTISSGMGTYAGLNESHAEHWPYSGSKAAVNYLMRAFAVLHPDIMSLLVSPGWVKTRVGGPDAPLEPIYVAGKIVDLILHHKGKLQSGTFIDYTGRVMPA